MDVMGRRGTRRQQLLDYHEEKRNNWVLKRKHYITLCGELAVEEAVDLS
jgi:hypothetical protein